MQRLMMRNSILPSQPDWVGQVLPLGSRPQAGFEQVIEPTEADLKKPLSV